MTIADIGIVATFWRGTERGSSKLNYNLLEKVHTLKWKLKKNSIKRFFQCLNVLLTDYPLAVEAILLLCVVSLE